METRHKCLSLLKACMISEHNGGEHKKHGNAPDFVAFLSFFLVRYSLLTPELRCYVDNQLSKGPVAATLICCIPTVPSVPYATMPPSSTVHLFQPCQRPGNVPCLSMRWNTLTKQTVDFRGSIVLEHGTDCKVRVHPEKKTHYSTAQQQIHGN